MSIAPAVGIDLGTTFSCVAVYKHGRAELIPNSEGDRLTPSIIYFDPKTGKPAVGQIADKLLPQYPKNGLLDAKRIIGRNYDDEFISEFCKSNDVHFTLVRGADNQAAFEVDVSNAKVIKKPEEVSAEVLRYLKHTASEYLAEDVTKAVISVPAYFSNAQRKATKKAAELAGLTVLKLITEPTAAAIHYVSDKNRNNSTIVAVDFGGGTLDVSLIKVNKNVFEVKAVYGDTLLGGRNFDKIMFDHFYKKFLNSGNAEFTTRKFKRRLNNLCTDLKKMLSANEQFTMFLDTYDGNADLDISMTRKKFEEISQHIFKRLMDVVQLCLYDSGVEKSDVDEVILVGGSIRIPKIRKLLSDYFGSNKIKTDLNPDEAVAAGASIHAAFLAGDCQDLEKYKVTEVAPMSLGISTTGGLMNFILPKNSSLPATASQVFFTSFNDQEEIDVSIYEGERRNIIYNNKLGEFTVTNLPKKRAGDVECTVKFILDNSGILTVSATENSTGRNNKLVLTIGQFRLSERKIKASIEDAKKYKKEDDIFNTFIRRKQYLVRICRHVLYDLKKIPFETDRDTVEKSSNEFLKSSDDMNVTEIEVIEAKFEAYKSAIHNILRKNQLSGLLP